MTHRPLFSICNPELTCTVSKYQTACGTVDIMMHTLERYFSKTRDTELTDRIAEALLKSTVEAGRIADKDPDNYEARAALMWGGSLSHNGLTGAGRDFFMQVHQLEHELSGMYPSIAHGAGLAALWPSWARFVCPSDVNRFARYAVQVWNIDMDFDCPMNTALAGIRATEDFYKSLGMPSSLKRTGRRGRTPGRNGCQVHQHGKAYPAGHSGTGQGRDDGNLQDGFGRVAGTGESRVWGYQPQKDNGHRSLTCPRNTKETENGCNRQAQKYTQVLRQGNTP